ncbi:hypothetical protein HBN65_03115 [Pseudomonas lundensis]|uniref:dermonecrotic toxin domain-containing protein n=1 Tax=Pseudomonas lundensis TaxID=86185 RepID=UPI001473A91E|nr:hypothetical protein [Pseudomonas lundensis]
MTDISTANGLGPHAAFIEEKLPAWIKHSHRKDLVRLRAGAVLGHEPLPDTHLADAPPWLREALHSSQARSRQATLRLAQHLKVLKGITEFAEPRLQLALQSHHTTGRALDVNTDCLFYLQRDQPVQVQSLLQAALLNFEGNEDYVRLVRGRTSAIAPSESLPAMPEKNGSGIPYSMLADALVKGSGFGVAKMEDELNNLHAPDGFSYRETLPMKPQTFSSICRALDLGQQYQDHLSEVFDSPQNGSKLRAQMVQAQKELLEVRLHAALIQKHISEDAYRCVSDVVQGLPVPLLGGKPVVFSQLSLYGFTIADVLLIGPYRSWLPETQIVSTPIGVDLPVFATSKIEPLVVYMPGAATDQLMEYASLEAFEHALAFNLRTPAYQQLFANLVPQGDAQGFLKRLNYQLYSKAPDPQGKEPPVYSDDVSLRMGQTYISSTPANLFFALNALHVARIKANARVLAVPTADADSKLLRERLEYYAGLGMDVLNAAAFFIPGVGEVMMAVMALQIGLEVYHGLEAFSVGDMDGAWAHLESVAINVGVGVAIAGAGYGVSKIPSGALSRWAESVTAIVSPQGKTRLWKPDLASYQAELTLGVEQPNALGQYTINGNTWVQIDQHLYEQVFDQELNTWRVKHPSDSEAYQPVLKHNHDGAWRFAHERPLTWDRQTLLRRLGYKVRLFDDETLARSGEISGVSDDALRKMYLDDLPVPAALADVLDLFTVGPVVEPGAPSSPEVKLLLQRFKSLNLSESSTREIVMSAGARDLSSLRKGRSTSRIDDQCRRYAQTGRLNRALAGIYQAGPISADTARIKNYVLTKVPESAGMEGVEQTHAIGRYATSHRAEMEDVLQTVSPRRQPSKTSGRSGFGYSLSGRGGHLSVENSLVVRLREVYPNVDDELALDFIQERLRGGHTDQQVFHFLNTRARESDALAATLARWAEVPGSSGQALARRSVMEKVIHCWRQGFFRAQEPYATLDLGDVDALPELTADFSHVRTLKGTGSLLLANSGETIIRIFPGIKGLELGLELEERDMMTVIHKIAALPQLKALSVSSLESAFSPAFMRQLTSMNQLQRLTVRGSLESLDVSSLHELRELKVASQQYSSWPHGVLDLPHLEQLDMHACTLRDVPVELYSGHERLWRGLRLNWSRIEEQSVLKTYGYLQGNAFHLADMRQWVDLYTLDCFKRMMPEYNGSFLNNLLSQFRRRQVPLHEQFITVLGVNKEFAILTQGLDTWTIGNQMPADSGVAANLRRAWKDGVFHRFAGEGQAGIGRVNPHLSLNGGHEISSLARIPSSGFEHIQHLTITGHVAPGESLDHLLESFTHVKTLNLSHNQIHRIPSSLTEFSQLEHLDLSHNELTVTPYAQSRLDRLRQLRVLRLRGNRVDTLNVSMMEQLEELDLSQTAIRAWPQGVFDLPRLRKLDLSRSGVTDVPQAALNGHDRLMSNTRLEGCALSRDSCLDLLGYAHRTNSVSAGWIPRGLLMEGKTGGEPEYFPLEVSQNPDMLLPSVPDLAESDTSLTPAARLQSIDPELSLRDAVNCIDRWMSSGEGALDIHARLDSWHRQYNAMTRQLNRWIDRQSYRVEAQWVSALDRRRASDRLMRAWRQMLTAETPEGASHARVIDFSDLCVGDLPQLPVVLEHITSIDLSGVRLTAHGSNDFLRSLPQLRTLRINNNALVELPGAVEGLDNLTRLEAAHNRLVNTEMLQSQLRSLAHLEWLDLSTNALESFNAGELPALRTLNLSGNALTRWPGSVMNLSELSELDLSNNRIHHIPDQLYDRTYNNLMAGTDVTDNPLEYDDLEALYDYQHSTGNGLGFTAEELETGLHHSDDSASDSEPEADEDLDAGIHESPSVQKARWFNEVPADSPKHRIWDVVSGRQGSDGLFHLLTELKNTRDFIEGKALLTARVWDVLEAAYNNEALGSELFVQARSPYTCGDGRILLFSDLEVKVHEFNVLKGVTSSEAGSVLLGLYKSLYRLERVEEIAREFMVQYPTIDPAEVRLDFRISLAERLQLPKQPKDMIYRNLVEHPSVELDEPFNVTLQKAYERVIATDNSPEFSHYLLSSEKWINYLKAQYPDECQALELQLKTEADQLEDRYPVINESYNAAIKALGSKKKREFETLYERLSHLERAKLNGQ